MRFRFTKPVVTKQAITRHAKGGFTLFELLFSLCMVALVASFAVPAYYARPEITLDNAARLLARDLRAAQNRAATYRMIVEFSFFANGDGYEVTDMNGHHLADPGGGGDFIRRYSYDGVFEGVHLSALDSSAIGDTHFDANGFALEGGHFMLTYLGAQRIVVLQEGSGLLNVIGLETPWADDGQ